MVDLDTYLMFYLCNSEIRSRVIPKLVDSELVTKLQKDLLNFFTGAKREGENIHVGEVLSYLTTSGYPAEVVEGLSKVLFDFTVSKSKEEQTKIIEKFSELIKKTKFYSILTDVTKSGITDIDEVVERMIKISATDLSGYTLLNFSDEETVKDIVERMSAKNTVIKSVFPIINQSLTYGGYKTGDLFLLTAAPGRGKTFFQMNEALGFAVAGVPTLQIFLGDMTEYSVILRELARLSGYNISYLLVGDNFWQVYAKYKYIFNSIRTLCLPSLTWDSDELYTNLVRILDEFPYKAFIIDYDLNIRKTTNDLYNEGGYLYSRMAGLVKSFNVFGMMITQPKVFYWDKEVIPQGGASESSRKEHCIDGMISLGRLRYDLPAGMISLPKTREGVPNQSPVYLDLGKSLIKQIDMASYEKILKDYGIKR